MGNKKKKEKPKFPLEMTFELALKGSNCSCINNTKLKNKYGIKKPIFTLENTMESIKIDAKCGYGQKHESNIEILHTEMMTWPLLDLYNLIITRIQQGF